MLLLNFLWKRRFDMNQAVFNYVMTPQNQGDSQVSKKK